MTEHPLISRVDGVQGGYPCIAGTRTPVRSIVEYFSIHGGNIDAVLADLPHLTREQVEAALAYYREQPELVDEDIVRQRDAIRRIVTVDVRAGG